MSLKKCLIALFLVFSFLFLWPHLVLLLSSKNKSAILDDFRLASEKRKIRFSGIFSFLYILIVDSYYRKWFYHRIGALSFLVSWYFPGNKTFYPSCKKVGRFTYLAHPCSTFINAESIGDYFTCRQNTTIGNKHKGDRSIPIIGDNVNVGANVCIIGDIRIGNNVTIGAGSVVVKSIPDNAVVVGNPARIIRID